MPGPSNCPAVRSQRLSIDERKTATVQTLSFIETRRSIITSTPLRQSVEMLRRDALSLLLSSQAQSAIRPAIEFKRHLHSATPIILAALLTAGCAWHYPPRAERNHLDAPHPSPERIAELAADGKPQVSAGAWLRLSSPFVLAGGSVRLTCFFPITRDHRYLRLGLIDAVSPIRTFTHATNFDQVLIESVPCGDMSAICDSLATSNRVLVHLEQSFTAKGTCNEGGER